MPRLPTIPGSPPSPLDVLPGCPFAPRCRYRHDRCDERPPLDGGVDHVDACWLPREDRQGLRGRLTAAAVAAGDPGDRTEHSGDAMAGAAVPDSAVAVEESR